MGWDATWVLGMQTLDRGALERAVHETSAAFAIPGHVTDDAVIFMVPLDKLAFEDHTELGEAGITEGPLAVEVWIRDTVFRRKDLGAVSLHASSNRSANRYAWMTACKLMNDLSRRLDGAPDELGDALTDLEAMLHHGGAPTEKWKARHAPDGDLEAAITRLWNTSSVEVLALRLYRLDARRRLELALTAARIRFAKSASREPALEKALSALEWYVEGKSRKPAVERQSGWLFADFARDGDAWPEGRRIAAQAVMKLVEGVFDDLKYLDVSLVFTAVKPEFQKQLGDLLRAALPTPTLASLRARR